MEERKGSDRSGCQGRGMSVCLPSLVICDPDDSAFLDLEKEVGW